MVVCVLYHLPIYYCLIGLAVCSNKDCLLCTMGGMGENVFDVDSRSVDCVEMLGMRIMVSPYSKLTVFVTSRPQQVHSTPDIFLLAN